MRVNIRTLSMAAASLALGLALIACGGGSSGGGSGSGDTQGPTAPTNLAATSPSANQIDLAWTASTDNVGVAGYKVYRNGTLLAQAQRIHSDAIGAAAITTTLYSDRNLLANTRYCYTVSAYDAAGNASSQSTQSCATTGMDASSDIMAPSTPVNVHADAVSISQINITWGASTDNIGVSGYRVYRNGSMLTGSMSGRSYSDTNLNSDTRYCYTVSAYDGAGNESFPSGIICATTFPPTSVDTTPPTQPANLTASVINTTQIDINWSVSSDYRGVAGYNIFVNNARLTTVGDTDYSHTGLTPNTTYCYQISAYDSTGNESLRSAQQCATTTIVTVDNPPTAPSAVSATAQSSTQVYLTWSGASDDHGVASYRVFKNGVFLTSVSSTAMTDSGLSYATNYCYTVYSVDTINQVSAASSQACATTSVATPGNLKWRYKAGGKVTSSAAVATDGTVYFGSEDGFMYALNSDGTLKWRYQTGDKVTSSPAIGPDGAVYFGSNDGYVYGIKSDGTLKWRYLVGVQYDGASPKIDHSSPAIDATGDVYIGANDGNLYCIDGDSGVLQWKYGTSGSWTVYASPTIGRDGAIYIAGGYTVHALNSDGTRMWDYNTTQPVGSSPVVTADGTVYIGAYDLSLHAVSPLGYRTWRYAAESNVVSTSAIGSDGSLYFGTVDGKLHAIASDRTVKWKYSTGSVIGYSSPTLDSLGNVYVGSYDGALYVVKSNGTLGWKYQTSGYIDASPTLGSNSTVYIGSADNTTGGNNYLYAIHAETGSLANSVSPMFRHDLLHTGRLQ